MIKGRRRLNRKSIISAKEDVADVLRSNRRVSL
jgi:hypothetical protein